MPKLTLFLSGLLLSLCLMAQEAVVELLPGSAFYNAREKNKNFLLYLKPDRLLHRFHKNAHLPVKDSVYGGWESEGLSGHTLGHYLSAASLMYKATNDQTLLHHVQYIVSELARCQQARGTGYVGAIPNEDSIFYPIKRGKIKTGGFDLNGGWSPWYTVHKVMAGLLDAYRLTHNDQALVVLKGMADWTQDIVGSLPDSSLQKMLRCEYGGMNDVLAGLYQVTKEKKYLDLSYTFFDDFVMLPLSKQIDPLPGKHSNTNVPKAIGSALQYELTGNKRDSTIASFFWETMTSKHSYVIGGNSNYEYCGEAGKLNDRLSDNTCETCNTYNMLKLTQHLNRWTPDSKYMDYFERALYNHILASQHPESGMLCYFVPLRMGTKKTFSDTLHTFTCCVGSGMENHSKYEEQIYTTDSTYNVWVNLFIPSTYRMNFTGLDFKMITDFPGSSTVKLIIQNEKKVPVTFYIRKPFWQTMPPSVKVNGKRYATAVGRAGYYTVSGNFRVGDVIEWELPMKVYTESMPDNPDRIAFKYGPLVLAGTLGKEMPDPVYGTPVLMADRSDVAGKIVKTSPNALVFEMKGMGKPFDVTLRPFYSVYDEYYSVYWDCFTEAAWTARQQEYEAEKRREKALMERTVDYFRIGEMQPERDHKLVATEKSYVSDAIGRMGREARADHYFSFKMKVDPERANALVLTYIGDDKDRLFDILVQGNKLTTVEWKGGKTGKFYDIEYVLTDGLTKGQQEIEVKVLANHGKTAGRVFGARVVLGE